MPQQKVRLLIDNNGKLDSVPAQCGLSKRGRDTMHLWTTDEGTFSIEIFAQKDARASSPFTDGATSFTGITKHNPRDSSPVEGTITSGTVYTYIISCSATKAVGDPDIVIND